MLNFFCCIERERVIFHIERTFPWCLNQSNSRRVFLCCYFFIWRSISCINAPYASFSKNEQDYSPFYQRSWILHNECYRIIWPLLLLILQFPLFRERRKDATEGHELRYFWNNPTQKMPCFVNLDYLDVARLSCRSFEIMASWFVIEILVETYWSITGPISNITAQMAIFPLDIESSHKHGNMFYWIFPDTDY